MFIDLLRKYLPWTDSQSESDDYPIVTVPDRVDFEESKFNPSNSQNRCGKEVSDDDLPEELGGYCCYRPVWKDEGDCIWHAETSNKPTDEIRDALHFESWLPEKYSHKTFVSRLDEVYLDNFRVEEDDNGISISGCTMANSDFSYADIDPLNFNSVNLSGSTFKKGNFEYANFQGCTLRGVNFHTAQLQNSRFHTCNLENADFTSAWLNGANLYNSDLTEANLRVAKLKDGAYLRKTDCSKANFEEAQIDGADLRGADLRESRFHQTLARSVRISEWTQFGDKCIYETESDQASESDRDLRLVPDRVQPILNRVRLPITRCVNRFHQDEDESEELQKATRVYRLYQRLLRENSLPDEIQHFRIRERHSRRKLALVENRFLSWLNLSAQRWIALYGESYRRVIGLSLFTVFTTAFFYPLFGIRDVANNKILTYWNGSPNGLIWTYGKSLYFSTSTFTTLGYGDLQPIGWGQAVATIESFTGAILIALLVFVFARQATW